MKNLVIFNEMFAYLLVVFYFFVEKKISLLFLYKYHPGYWILALKMVIIYVN